MKKAFSILLAILVISPALYACNNNTPAESTDDSTASDTTIADTVDEGPTLEVPDKTFDGADFNIFSASDGNAAWTHYYTVAAEEIEGDIVSQAVYDRNEAVQNQFDVSLVYHPFDAWGSGITARQQALNESATDSGLYDIMTANIATAARHILSNALIDIYSVDHLDMDKPWWYTEMNKTLDLNGHMLTATNHFCIQNTASIIALYFNKSMQENHNIEDIYQLVYDGTWTIDKFLEICALAGKDLNNDAIYDENDQYGLVAQNLYTFALVTGMDVKYIDMDENGNRYLVGGTDRVYKVSEKIQKLLKADYFGSLDTMPNITSLDGLNEANSLFFTGDQSLFVLAGLDFATRPEIRDMESYGLIPSPKLDEAQTHYISQTVPESISIVANAGDMEMVGIITEALAYYSYKLVTPTYFEDSLGEKLARDPDTMNMLNIINENLNCDFSYAYYTILDTGLCYSIPQNPQMSSWFATYQTAYEKRLNTFMNNIEKLFEDDVNG